jgi:hypothetical protein
MLLMRFATRGRLIISTTENLPQFLLTHSLDQQTPVIDKPISDALVKWPFSFFRKLAQTACNKLRWSAFAKEVSRSLGLIAYDFFRFTITLDE